MRNLCVLVLCLIALSVIVAPSVSGSDTTTVRVGLYANSPKIFTDAQGNPAGFWPDIIEYIADAEGWSIQCCPEPGRRV